MNILSLGDLLLDLVVRYDPTSGEADAGPDAVQMWPGGSAANFAVQAARLGAQVRFVSRVGADFAGEMLVRSLYDAGVTTEVQVVDHEATGRVLVMVDPQGHRRMWSYPGASAALHPGDLDPDWFRKLDAFHLTGYSLLRNGPRKAALHALQLARQAGTRFCTLDPNPSHLISDFGPARFRDLLADLRFDAIFPNLEEGTLLCGQKNPHDSARGLLDLSPLVVLTLGEQGCIVSQPGHLFEVEAAHVDTIADATGAGDAFAAAFVVEYLGTQDLRAAAIAANRAAAQVVSRIGAR